MAWHHIIPFSLLAGVWNRLIDRHIETELPEIRVALRQYLLLSQRNQPDIDVLIERMRVGNIDQKRASHYLPQPLSVPEFNQIATSVVWPSWNAVEGPKQRGDDPQDRYMDRFTSGLTAGESARMRAIEQLLGQLQSFLNGGPSPGPAILRALSQAAASARPSLQNITPIRYRPDMWIDDGGGIWRKRRDGERYTVAVQ